MTFSPLLCKDGRRLHFRRFTATDKAALRRFDEALSARSRHLFTPHRYDEATLDQLVDRNRRGADVIFVASPADQPDRIVGYFFLWYAERPVALLGIGFADDFQGQGLGGQAMRLLIQTGRELGLDGIELTTDLTNDRAYALYEKCGFRFLRNVDNLVGDGSIRTERAMFLPLKPNAQPMTEPHAPPV